MPHHQEIMGLILFRMGINTDPPPDGELTAYIEINPPTAGRITTYKEIH